MGERVRVRKDRDERREQILVCARELFSERPYEEVSNTEIAAVAGVSRGLLNHYFGTKRELYLAVVERMLHIPPVPVPAYEPGASVRERVTESITGWLELLERNAGTWLVALDMAAGSAGDDDLARLVDAAREGAVDHITEVVGLSRLAAEHPEVRSALRGFSGMAEAATREWLRHGRLTRAQAHVLLEDTLMHLIEETVPKMTAAG
ncbi:MULTISPECIES: TetR/AcrR family transcriptional regulator [Actinomadura]|uniref:TetR family transcriptional regulator n=2 Tax=Actinomadura TaxID=1988 RepID=A0A7D3VRJ7_ACTVE|nr:MULTISPECIES: TetR/AcrR family transcriptional regulator [Actinomadura]MBO2461057.1 TetR/AcrR family transcriptional regulator [Actinomadura violacea]QKG18456.1 TetR family transcriptional regulator [Actinomadura verrucosospora]